MMRFTVEERHLTDMEGRPVLSQDAVSFVTFEAETVDDAIRLYVRRDEGELLGNVLKFPGFLAVATVRKPTGVYTVQLTPSSQAFSRT